MSGGDADFDEDEYGLRITLYDSTMKELGSVYGLYGPDYWNYSWSGDSTVHYFSFPGLASYFDAEKLVIFRFFDTPVTVTGDYYIGVHRGRGAHVLYHNMDILHLRECHGGPRHFPPSGHRIKSMDGRWSDVIMDTGSVPLLWAIVRVPCEAVDSVSLVADTSGCLSADWERPPYQSAWEVRFVLPNGSELVESVDTNHWEYCGLLPGRTYTLYLRSQCDEADGTHSWSDWSGAFAAVGQATQGIAGVGGVAADVTLRPNPATDEVTVDAKDVSEVVTVTVTDMSGVEVLRREGVRLPLTVGTASLAAGTYVVRVVTPLGTAVQKLAVLR